MDHGPWLAGSTSCEHRVVMAVTHAATRQQCQPTPPRALPTTLCFPPCLSTWRHWRHSNSHRRQCSLREMRKSQPTAAQRGPCSGCRWRGARCQRRAPAVARITQPRSTPASLMWQRASVAAPFSTSLPRPRAAAGSVRCGWLVGRSVIRVTGRPPPACRGSFSFTAPAPRAPPRRPRSRRRGENRTVRSRPRVVRVQSA